MTSSVYLHGSVALGTDSPSSDVDVAVITDKAFSASVLHAVLVRVGLVEVVAGRDLDLCVATPAEVMGEPLLANSLGSARLLAGSGVPIVAPAPAEWARAAATAAVWALQRHAGPSDLRSAVLWAAGAWAVVFGAPVPVGKHAAAAAYAERVGDGWTGLVDAALAREPLEVERVAAFVGAEHG